MLIRPEVQAEIDATREAMAALRAAVMARPVTHQIELKPRAERILRLDRLYTEKTGVLLTEATAPAYSGPMHQWREKPAGVKYTTIHALLRLRAGKQSGALRTTEFLALNYFSSIWPSDLEWPRDIPRPTTGKKEKNDA